MFCGVAGRFCLEGGVVQGQGAGIAVLAVLQGGGKLPQNCREVIRVRFNRDRLRLHYGIPEEFLLLDRFKMMVGIALQLKGIFNQLAGIVSRK